MRPYTRVEPRACRICGTVFRPNGNRPAGIYCSRKCLNEDRWGAGNPAWKGGRVMHGDGYVMVKMPSHPSAKKNGYVLEHRLIMEQKLGRLLEPHETVHHRDGNRQNNDPANLELWVGRHGKGASAPHCATCQCFVEIAGTP